MPLFITFDILDQFSIKCSKTKTGVLLWPITKDTENVRERVKVGFGFTSDWLRKWRDFFKPITERSNAKPKQTQITFDTQAKPLYM